MASNEIPARYNWLTKFIVSFLSIVGLVNALLTFLPLLPDTAKQYIATIAFSLLIAALAAAVVFPVYWHVKEKKEPFNSDKYHAGLLAIMRYWLAFQMTIYAFVKFFKTQFGVSFHRDDALMGSLNGADLTWGYFGHSYPLSVIIGLLQLSGALLILFRRTTLLGVAILLPVMINILLINFFYLSGPATLISSLLITLALFYLLVLRKSDIIALFWHYTSTTPQIGNNTWRTLARVFSILPAVLFVVYFTYHDVKAPAKLLGKWKVEAMTVNGKKLTENAGEKSPLAWKNIYFEERHEIYCSPDPDFYNANNSLYMRYTYDDKSNALNVISYEGEIPDTIPVRIEQPAEGSISWNMVLNKDTIQMELKKAGL